MNSTRTPIIHPEEGYFPEIIDDYLEHGVIKCVDFNRRGTILAGDKGKEVADDENSKKPFKSDLPRKDPPPYRNDNNDDDGNDDGAPPSIGVSITQVDTTSTIEDFAIVAFENQTTRNVKEGSTPSAHIVKLDVRTSYGDVERDDMGINHGFKIRYLKSRI